MTSREKTEELVCITCPRGCLLTAQETDGGIEISGNFCPRGEEYGKQELTNPVRVLTALMRLQDNTHPKAPVHRGDILIRDLCGTGSNVIATRDS